ncbi:alpha/beta hydrolase [Neobacillus piezotolerans]|uniref:Alpha/beta hydrolase n=1 Tax=Neobacillus piezotolerans TaxID=2259171 RepID=A0A3D8GQZ5_9BACI|nr:alpha/beta hydrolase [Neobacillus piezotolerans]RDU36900.1 alpha/beta hydrolase [Neobacillus piezotolerans]
MSHTAEATIKEINGISVYYEWHPSSPGAKTVVLLHGFLSSTFSFRKLVPLLCKDYNVLNIDVPPFGKSGKTKKFLYSYKNIAATMIALLDELGIKNPVLAGHSMGGQYVLNMIALQPHLATKAVLFCSSSYLEPPGRLLSFGSQLPFFHLAVKRWLVRSGGVKKNLKLVVHDQSLIDEDMLRGYMQPFLDKQMFHGLGRLIHDREGELRPEALHKIITPCLLIWGEHDRVVPLAVGNRLHGDLKNSELVVLENTGHLVPEERPEEVCRLMKEFIERQEP